MCAWPTLCQCSRAACTPRLVRIHRVGCSRRSGSPPYHHASQRTAAAAALWRLRRGRPHRPIAGVAVGRGRRLLGGAVQRRADGHRHGRRAARCRAVWPAGSARGGSQQRLQQPGMKGSQTKHKEQLDACIATRLARAGNASSSQVWGKPDTVQTVASFLDFLEVATPLAAGE
jgi:hypothetical protein